MGRERIELTWHDQAVSQEQREGRNGHRGCVVWFTGLSGCGKSTVANVVDQKLFDLSLHSFLLDGDNVRQGLNAAPNQLESLHGAEFANRFGLGFSDLDRAENIRRVGAVAQLFASAGLITLAAFVSPFRRDRDAVRAMLEAAGEGRFIEVFVDTPLDVCEQRDPKGLYKKARAGEIRDFTGIDSPFESPLQPELVLAGAERTPEQLAEQVIDYLASRGFIGKRERPST